MENFEHNIETPHELTKDFQWQESNKEIIDSETKQLQAILETANDSSVDLYSLKAQYASFMNVPKDQFEEELNNSSGNIDFMSVNSKEELIDLMKKDLENLQKQNEKNLSLLN